MFFKASDGKGLSKMQNEKEAVDMLMESERQAMYKFIEAEIYVLQKSLHTIRYFEAFYDFKVGHYEHWTTVENWDCEYLATTFTNERGDVCWMCDIKSFTIKYPF